MELESILPLIRFDAENGTLRFNGIRYLLMRPETIIGFQKEAEKALGERAAELFYNGGFEGGSRTAGKLLQEQKLSPEQILQGMCVMGTQIGWGAFRVAEFSGEAQQFTIEIASSAWAQAHGPAASPVCHLIAGVFGGLAEVIFGRKHRVREIECVATGNPRCIFRTSE
jgi:hypothetical protein